MARRIAFASICLFWLFAACALRPRYNELVPHAGAGDVAAAETISFRLIDPVSGAPIAGASVTAGHHRNRAIGKSDATGLVTLPWTAALAKDNPLVVIDLPGDASGYFIQPVAAASPDPTRVTAPNETPAQVDPVPVPAATPAGDGTSATGSPTSDSAPPPDVSPAGPAPAAEAVPTIPVDPADADAGTP